MNRFHERIMSCAGTRRGLLTAMLCAAGIRFVLLALAYLRTGTRVITQGDTGSYVEPGRELFLHGAYSHGSYAHGTVPEIDRTPGYPIFLMVAGMLRNNVLLAASVQILLSILTLMIVVRIARLVFQTDRAAVIAGWLFALEPASLVYSIRLMPETLFVLLLLLMLERFLTYFANAKLSAVALAAIALAAATYVRPVSYYLVLPLALGLVFCALQVKGNWWKAPALLLLSVLPLLAIWQVRNRLVSDYSGFSSIVEKNLYFYQSAEVEAEMQHRSLAEEQGELGYPDEASYARVHPEQERWSQRERLEFMRTEAMRTLSNHRWLYLKSHFVGVAVVAFTPCGSEWMQLLGLSAEDSAMPKRVVNEGVVASVVAVIRRNPGTAVFMGALEVILLALYLLAVVGVVRGKGGWRMVGALCGVAVYFLLISGGAQAVGRYRVPVMPELCILAAGGLASLLVRRLDSMEMQLVQK